MVAYAAIVLDGIKTAQVPSAGRRRSGRPRARAPDGRHSALVHYARGAADGEQGSLEAIRAFGVDPERLLLGMSASPKSELVARVEPTAVEVLVAKERADDRRAHGARRDVATPPRRWSRSTRSAACSRRTTCRASTCHLAVGQLESASHSRENEAVRDTAKTALAEARTTCRK
jgi:hypothetical protein